MTTNPPQYYTNRPNVSEAEQLTINVSGRKFYTTIEELEFHPESTLGYKFYRDRYYDPKKNEFFLDRHIGSFEVIFESVYVYKQPLLRPLDIHLDIFLEEIRYYRLPEGILRQYLESEGLIKDVASRRDINFENRFKNYSFWHNFRHNLWELFEFPRSSVIAGIIGWVSILAIVLSILVFCLETVKEVEIGCKSLEKNFQEQDVLGKWLFGCCRIFRFVDVICVGWFTFELTVRLLAAPELKRFLKSSLNIIDILALLPYFIQLVLGFWKDQSELAKHKYLTYVMRVIKVARAARVLKLSRYSRALRVLGKTLTTSSDVFFLLVCFHCMMALTFATLVYALDGEFEPTDDHAMGETELEVGGSYDQNKQEQHYHRVRSSVDALWWASVTLTTVGYGDIVPASTLAKIVGGVCACVAIISLALPVPVIVSNFNYLYNVDRDDLKINPEDLMEPDQENEEKSLINPYGLMYEDYGSSGHRMSKMNNQSAEIVSPNQNLTTPNAIDTGYSYVWNDHYHEHNSTTEPLLGKSLDSLKKDDTETPEESPSTLSLISPDKTDFLPDQKVYRPSKEDVIKPKISPLSPPKNSSLSSLTASINSPEKIHIKNPSFQSPKFSGEVLREDVLEEETEPSERIDSVSENPTKLRLV